LYDTARYGDRPFPVVPVDYFDRKHNAETHSAQTLQDKINSPAIEGSTFNLFQEMSYGQLYPHATVPSAGLPDQPYDTPIDFSDLSPQGVCPPTAAFTTEPLAGTGTVKRVENGWYQLPRMTDYYGTDKDGPNASWLGAQAGQTATFDIDSACGPSAKAVYDAAAIADQDIDYSDYDTDKDGVVDFFMMVFAGVGGHGASVQELPPYDNIWPHSSSLEFSYTDQATGLTGYISKDQLKDLEGRPLWYTDTDRVAMTTTDPGDDSLKVPVRVGPYNVNPEDAIDHASVISHEYGHSLGLPDFYSTGKRSTYGDWNLMATDKSQNMDVFSKQDLGWIVPRVLPANATTTVPGWKDSKVNTHRIDWVTPDGTQYHHDPPEVANGEAYTVKLPGRQLISPEKVSQGASPSHVWWSGAGNDYGCAPNGGHNLDIALPDLADVPPGSTVTLKFKSYWDIEWDYDYGFVLISPDHGKTYASVASQNNYTTPIVQNPNTNNCQAKYGNGITGTSGAYANGTAPVNRVTDAPGSQYPDGPFLQDSYDISALAGTDGAVVRFSYATDPGLAHPGWFIDDVEITVGTDPVYKTDFEDLASDQLRLFNGGCKDDVRVATRCTKGWQYVSSDVASVADHGYYLEMRDRSGFDYDGKGENDRAAIGFVPGMLLTYTDESHGYGNAGTDDPPAQSPLDAEPEPGLSVPKLNDAAFGAGASFSDANHVDNYLDPSSESGNWEFRFGCLSFKVGSMSGDDEGPDSAVGVGGDLVGDVTFKTTPRCAAFDYGYGTLGPNAAPTAKMAVKPRAATVGQRVTFDGSESFDDRQAPADLTYSWAFGDGSSGTGRTTSHTYSKVGTYTVTLTVTDADGAKTTVTETVTVGAASSDGSGPVAGAPAPPASGGG
ncbi:MAG: immune inhibitor, partial [Actinomycetota bacterium]|nr:immune inhibitor [Actinomycetota bacterium]